MHRYWEEQFEITNVVAAGIDSTPGCRETNKWAIPFAATEIALAFVQRCGRGPAGKQVSRSYSQDSNDIMLQHYGFVEPGNRHDQYAAPALLQRIRGAVHVPHSRLLRARELDLLAPLQNVRQF